MKGLIRGTVSVEPHNVAWKEEAENCISLLAEILKKDMVDAQHVGSTAICGICAKPIIDIAVGVKNLRDVMKYNEELAENGIIYRHKEHGEQLLYICGDMQNDIRTHHIHIVIWNSEEWNNYLNFRDYMNCHEEEARAYAQLKVQLAKQYPKDRGAYTAGKQEYIDRVIKKATAWRNNSHR